MGTDSVWRQLFLLACLRRPRRTRYRSRDPGHAGVLPDSVSPPRTFAFGMGMGMGMGRGMTFAINGRVFDPNRIDTRVRLNTVEDWEILNPDGIDHPFHVHTNPFQVLDVNGVPEPAWRDRFLVRAGSRVRLRLQIQQLHRHHGLPLPHPRSFRSGNDGYPANCMTLLPPPLAGRMVQ